MTSKYKSKFTVLFFFSGDIYAANFTWRCIYLNHKFTLCRNSTTGEYPVKMQVLFSYPDLSQPIN